MVKYPNPYYTIGTILILISIVLYLELSIKETAILPAALGCSTIYKGVSIKEKMKTENSSRERIMGTSFILPGLVQVCDMGKKVTGMAMIATCIVCYSVLISITFSYITIDSVGERPLGMMLVFSLIFLFFDMVFCMIQSNEFCNQKGLQYIGGEFEGDWTNTSLAYRLTILVMLIISIMMTILILNM